MGLGLLGTALAGGLEGAGEVAKGYIKEEADLNLEQRRAEIEAQRQETLRHWSDQADQRRAAREDARNAVTDQFAREKFTAERSDADRAASLDERKLSLDSRETSADSLAKYQLGLMNSAPSDLNSEEGKAWLTRVNAWRAITGKQSSQNDTKPPPPTVGAANPNVLFSTIKDELEARGAAKAEQGATQGDGAGANDDAGTKGGSDAKASSAQEDRLVKLTGELAQLSHLPEDNPQVQYLKAQIAATEKPLAQESGKETAKQATNKSKEAGDLSTELRGLVEQRKLLRGRLAEGSPSLQKIDERIIRIRERLNMLSR